MARYLALDWDHQQLHLVAATVAGGMVKIQRAAVWRETQSPNIAQAEELGRLLRERMKEAGIGAAPLLACVGRDRVILKELRVPPVPLHEEPGVVRFQAVKELTDPPEEVVIDYAAVAGPNGERRAMTLIARCELVQAYQAIARAAGLKLAGLTPRPFGIAQCLRRQLGSILTPAPSPPEAAVAVLAIGDRWAEFGVLRGESLIYTRSLTVGPGLAGEVKRNLAVYAGQAPHHPVAALYVADSGEHAALRERLMALTALPVHPFDPFGGTEQAELPGSDRGGFAGAVGLLHCQADRREMPVNFVHPKQPTAPSDPNRRRILIAAAAACLALAVLGGFGVYQLYAKQQEIDRRQGELTALDARLNRLKEDVTKHDAVQDWVKPQITWLDELYELTAMFPDPNQVRITHLVAEPGAALAKGATSNARLKLTGVTSYETLKQVYELRSKLFQQAFYGVGAPTISGNTGADRRAFGAQFQLSLDVKKRSPDDYKQTIEVPVIKAPERRRGGFPGGGFPRGGPAGGGEANEKAGEKGNEEAKQ